jgi:nascent polypeptide-associated complex subunit alpha
MQGQTIYQVIGKPELYERGKAPIEGSKTDGKPGISISDEDVALVAEKAGVSEDEARKALEECEGQPAEAIIKLMTRSG